MRLILLILLLLSFDCYSQHSFEICEDGRTFTYSTEIDMDGTVEWFLNGSPISTGNQVDINFSEPGEYEIVAIGYNQIGCPGDPVVLDVVVTQCDPLIYWVPNTFTPDNNEFNQTWGPILTSGLSLENFNLKVFNRWGETIWETSDSSSKWDGTYNGELIQSGTYVWHMVIDYLDNAGRKVITGHVTIIR